MNNFLDAELESSAQMDATSQESEEKKHEQDQYLRELELINDLPELLLGTDSQRLTTSHLDKKIICDFDDFEVGSSSMQEDSQHQTRQPVDKGLHSHQDQIKKSQAVLKAQLKNASHNQHQ